MLSGMRKLPGYSGKAFRSESRQVADAARSYRKGEVFQAEGFFSTARGSTPAQREGNVAISVTASGRNGRDVSQIMPHGKKELEVLFPPGTRFSVESVFQSGQGFMIFLREL